MTIKDSLDTAGVISTGGTKGRESFVPKEDATVVYRLKNAGAILLGKTNTPELTLSYETDNLIYGLTNNPFDLARSPGGSSGGAAAIVAAGGAPFDIGSDYGGSIRLPSHFCGIAGIKPSAGRVPRTGHIYPFGGVQDSFQQIGPLARYVDDLSLLLQLIAGPDAADPGVFPLEWHEPEAVDLQALRISFHTDNGIATPTPETQRTVTEVALRLESIVIAVDDVKPAGVEQTMHLSGLYSWDGGAAVKRLLGEAGTTESPRLTQEDPALDAAELDALLARWYSFRSSMHSFMADYDVIVCPANAGPAPVHGPEMEEFSRFTYTFTYNLTGWPAAVVRAGTSPEGLPIGVQIVARPGREDVALAVAKFVETEFGGFQRSAL
jgi:amidase